MGRKKGGKNSDTDLKVQEALEKVIKEGKTQQEVADELGVDKSTISDRVRKGLNSAEIQAIVGRSRERLIHMLSRCDDVYHRILTYSHPDNFGNQLKAATNIYKTFGLIQDEAQIQINNIIPIKVTVDGKEYEFNPQANEQSETY